MGKEKADMYPVSKDHIGRIERLACIGETTTEITHELNNQLTVLLGYVTILQQSHEKRGGGEPEYLDRLVETCEKCCTMARRILDYARGGQGERKRLDLCGVILKPVEIRSAAFESAEIEVRIRFPKERMEALVDEFQLQQVVLNILNNAHHELLKVRQRVFEIDGRREKGKAVIMFRDNGPGIRDEHRDKIFEPFFTTKPSGQGTGLGLSISRRIVEEHGGSLRAEKGIGSGAAFVLDLPLAKKTAEYCGSAVTYGITCAGGR